jgi:predicted anti-sigma-YlaC factor YlaD
MPAKDELNCRDFVEWVTDYLETTLPPELSERVEAHLEICEGCRLYLGQMRLTVRALAMLRRDSPAATPQPIRQRLVRAFREARA